MDLKPKLGKQIENWNLAVKTALARCGANSGEIQE